MIPPLALLLFACLAPRTVAAPVSPPAPSRCSCAVGQTVEEAVGGADAVFRARVLRVETDVVTEPGWGRYSRQRVTLRVAGVWKGALADTAVLFTGAGGGDCGFPFRRGEDYVIYAGREDGELLTGLCTRTAAASRAGVDLQRLGPMARPRPATGRP